MQLTRLLPLALAGATLTAAQSSSSNTSLSDALASQNSTLSMLNSLLASQPSLVKALSGMSNITLLAPSNDAIGRFVSDNPDATTDSGLVAAVLTYHVLNGTRYASDLSARKSAFIPTLLTNSTYANVTGGQRVQSTVDGGNVVFVSGGGAMSTVKTPNVNFTGGTIHIIDRVLTLPMGDAQALTSANLTDLAGALTQANLVSTVAGMKDVTIFAPNDAAFNSIGNLLANISDDQLADILKYHVVSGSVVYSAMISGNMNAKTVQGADIHISMGSDGSVFVNSAKVVTPDVLVANGVVHVIDNVLNPQNPSATPNPSVSTQSPAYSGASSTPAPFNTASTTASASSTAAAAGLAVPTGAVGAAALFGGAAAALLANM